MGTLTCGLWNVLEDPRSAATAREGQLRARCVHADHTSQGAHLLNLIDGLSVRSHIPGARELQKLMHHQAAGHPRIIQNVKPET